MSSVRCSIDSIHSNEAAVIQPGSLIAVKGICSGYNADEMLGSDVILVRSAVDSKNNSTQIKIKYEKSIVNRIRSNDGNNRL